MKIRVNITDLSCLAILLLLSIHRLFMDGVCLTGSEITGILIRNQIKNKYQSEMRRTHCRARLETLLHVILQAISFPERLPNPRELQLHGYLLTSPHICSSKSHAYRCHLTLALIYHMHQISMYLQYFTFTLASYQDRKHKVNICSGLWSIANWDRPILRLVIMKQICWTPFCF